MRGRHQLREEGPIAPRVGWNWMLIRGPTGLDRLGHPVLPGPLARSPHDQKIAVAEGVAHDSAAAPRPEQAAPGAHRPR